MVVGEVPGLVVRMNRDGDGARRSERAEKDSEGRERKEIDEFASRHL